ncbi:MAG: GntR family transcriptional regulator [Anaerolineaceae bacterium]|nr:GntR family transcriptional regulator [Anaerolineaceae bacterium]
MSENTSLPLYIQVKQKLMERIQSGEFNDGDMLPTENALREEFDVSRATIRNALNEIENERMIVRKRGVGTIVKKPKFKKELMKLQSFTNLMRSRGLTPRKETLTVEIIDTPKEVEEHLKNRQSNKSWFLKRLLLADEKPIGLQYLYLPNNLTFSPDDLVNMQSFYELVKEKHNIIPSFAEEVLTATVADAETASIMQIEEGAPLLTVWRTVYDEDGAVFEVSNLLYIADSFEYSFKLYA